MRLWARGTRGVWQAASDVAMLLWILLCLWSARVISGTVDAMSTPARRAGSLMQDLIAQLDTISARLARVPEIGDKLGLPFRALARMLADMSAQTGRQADGISSTADTLGVLAFLVPVAIMAALWLPRRLAFVRENATAQRFIDEEADLDLFALRAMAHVPMRDLARVSSDPVGAWREGDTDVIRRLALLELDRVGLRPPRRTAAVPADTRPATSRGRLTSMEWDDEVTETQQSQE